MGVLARRRSFGAPGSAYGSGSAGGPRRPFVPHLGHGPHGHVRAKDSFPTANPVHHLDAAPLLRALFVQLDQWACDGIEPPASQVPRLDDGTAVRREAVLARFEHGAKPDPLALPHTPAIDPQSTTWPLDLGDPLVALVADVDADGNERAGFRLPAVSVPVAAYTGWNPRAPVAGLPDVLYEFVGSRLPLQSGRPFPDRDTYALEARAAADALVTARFLLSRDVERTVTDALRFFDEAG